jgi:hypothetical protein
MAKRTDVHSPGNLVTENYDYVWAFDNKQPFVFGSDFALDIAHKLARSERPHGSNSRCDHCGAHIRYAAVLRYRPTGDHITVGETCLDNRFTRATVDFRRMRKAAQLDREKQRIVKARAAFVLANPDLAFMDDEDAFTEGTATALPDHIRTNSFIADVARKLRYYGDLSERQIDAIRKAIVRENERVAKRAAERAAEHWVRVPDAAIGRHVVTGTILMERWDDGYYGPVHKMLMKVSTPEGDWKLWTTMPSSMSGGEDSAEKGDIVTINVTVTRSDRDRDEVYGIGKRPAEVRS